MRIRCVTAVVAVLAALVTSVSAEPIQIPGSRIVLDLPAGFTATERALENARLGAMVRAFREDSGRVEDWERSLQISARANRRGTLARADTYLYFYYLWPGTSLADFTVIFRADGGAVRVLYEVDTAAIDNGLISVADIERSLASARPGGDAAK